MNAQVHTSTEGEIDSNFNFEQWVNDNDLSEIKQLLLKHKVINKAALSFNSAEFQSLMSDPELYKTPQMIPIITNAIKNDDSYIIVSEEEHTVMDSIKKNLKKLEQIEQEINVFKETYPKSAQTKQKVILAHTKKTQQKINDIFDNINKAVENKRNALLSEVMNATSNLNDQNNNEAKEDDNKEMDMISKFTEKIQTENEYLNNKLKVCKNMIKKTKSNDDRTKRKQAMIQIGDEVQNKFNKTDNEFTKNKKFIQNVIDNNTKYKINIDFKFNEKKHQKILQLINDFGIISTDRMLVFADLDEIAMKQIKSQLIETQQEITNLKNISSQQQNRINNLENQVLQKDQQIAQNFALLNEALTYKTTDFGWEYEAKEGSNPVFFVSKNPGVVRLLNGEYQFSVNVKRNPEIKSIEEICKCIMVLWKGTAARLFDGAVKCGSTHCLCGPRKTKDRKIVAFKRNQQRIAVEVEKQNVSAVVSWVTGQTLEQSGTYNLSAVKVMNANDYKIYKLEKDKNYWKKRYENTQKQ